MGKNRKIDGTTHVMFLICDHYEPQHKMTTKDHDVERVKTWVKEYPIFAKKCQNLFGHHPKHTWFYPPHHGLNHLHEINKLVFDGYGELELHYHHDNDTSESLHLDLKKTIESYNEMGILLNSGSDIKPGFAFVHGDWALDNSAPDGKYCGVNDEITILQKLGCWGDFTMPSTEHCQTRKINSIYYAQDDPERPKSHDTGIDLRVGGSCEGRFFLMQGPLGINFKTKKFPKIENSNITSNNWGREDRVKTWLDSDIHVKGKPEWKFIKLHTHGAVERDHDALFGDKAIRMHSTLNKLYNDGEKFQLHYVTAREAYNICKAAECGEKGNPDYYRNYSIKPYANSFYRTTGKHRLQKCTSEKLEIYFYEKALVKDIFIKSPVISSVRGEIDYLILVKDKLEMNVKCNKDSKLQVYVSEDIKIKVSSQKVSATYESNDGIKIYTLINSVDEAISMQFEY